MGPGKSILDRYFKYEEEKAWSESDEALLPGSIAFLLNGSDTVVWKYEGDSLNCFAASYPCHNSFAPEAESLAKWNTGECTKDEQITYCPIQKNGVFWGVASGRDRAIVLRDRDEVFKFLNSKP